MKEGNEEFRRIYNEGPEFPEWLALRDRVLRKPLGLSFSEEDIAAEADQVHLVVLRDGKVVGGLIFQERHGDTVTYQMRQVVVEPELQGQGLGRRLVGFAENFAAEQGVETIILHSRETAVPFYEGLDYEAEGDLFEEIGIPHLKMSKKLREDTP